MIAIIVLVVIACIVVGVIEAFEAIDKSRDDRARMQVLQAKGQFIKDLKAAAARGDVAAREELREMGYKNV